MPSLLDIAPPEINSDTVEIRGVPLTVHGVTAAQWAELYRRFPELRAVVAGRQTDSTNVIPAFEGQVALIAAGLGNPGDAETENQIIDRLTSEDQRALVEGILRLSLPGHIFGPLRNGHAPSRGAAAESGKASATK